MSTLLPHVDDSFKTFDQTNVAFMRKYLILSAYPDMPEPFRQNLGAGVTGGYYN